MSGKVFMEKDEIYQKMLTKVIMFLAYKPRTRKEISVRLGRYLKSQKDLDDEIKKDIAYKIFEYLEENKLIDDEEFIKLFIESKTRGKKALGKKAIENKLIAKGIDKEDAGRYINAAINEEDELKAAVRLIERKFGLAISTAEALDQNHKGKDDIKTKMGRYLLSRGFSYSISRQAVDYLLKRP
ncbi:MAG: regulatory protein RecX [Patescibacteria group bacterium]